MTVTLILLLLPRVVLCIWPPPYEIKLDQGETFVISELPENDEFYDDGDEMIRSDRSKDDDEGKYFRIHQMAIRYNKRRVGDAKSSENMKKIKEHNFDLDDPMAWEGGFVDKNGDFIQPDNENVYYLNEMAKSLIESKIDRKREELVASNQSVEEKVENYDYSGFKAEYSKEVQEAALDNNTLNFTEIKEEEDLKEAIETIIVQSDVKNCTLEERKGIGLSAIKCVLADFKKTRSTKGAFQLCEKFLKISLIWLSVYLVIAIPCWCSRGWCCCCCCCKCCKPRDRIEEVKRFFMQNPTGVYQKQIYEPTPYEIYTQKRLEKSLFNL